MVVFFGATPEQAWVHDSFLPVPQPFLLSSFPPCPRVTREQARAPFCAALTLSFALCHFFLSLPLPFSLFQRYGRQRYGRQRDSITNVIRSHQRSIRIDWRHFIAAASRGSTSGGSGNVCVQCDHSPVKPSPHLPSSRSHGSERLPHARTGLPYASARQPRLRDSHVKRAPQIWQRCAS